MIIDNFTVWLGQEDDRKTNRKFIWWVFQRMRRYLIGTWQKETLGRENY
jgi:hypothetical protein